jgi:hypothetical protein
VDLASGAVAYHDLREPTSALQRLRDWIEPPAYAKAAEGSFRYTHWLGNGLLAVTGDDTSFEHENPVRRPFGLRTIDMRDWTLRTISGEADQVAYAPDAMFAARASWDARTGRTRGMGLTAYELDGAQRFHRFGRRPLRAVYAAGPYVYATLWARAGTHVLDARTGRTVHWMRARELPILLVP